MNTAKKPENKLDEMYPTHRPYNEEYNNYSPISLNSGRILFSVSTIPEASSSTSDDKHEKEKKENHKQDVKYIHIESFTNIYIFYIQVI